MLNLEQDRYMNTNRLKQREKITTPSDTPIKYYRQVVRFVHS